MTQESIIKNIKRMTSFYDDEREAALLISASKEISDCKSFLNFMGRLLDWHGAHQNAHSTLYVNGNDFNELDAFGVKLPDYYSHYAPDSKIATLIFTYCGYRWWIMTKEYNSKAHENTRYQ